ncbi:hypothetical protein ACRAWD_27770 [Caulobacter segnis]
MTAEYYAQRASAGLIISEATQISQQGQGYQDTPGIYSQAQIEGWREAPPRRFTPRGAYRSAAAGTLAASLTSTLQPGGGAPVAPSAIRAQTKTFVGNQFVDVSEPRALDLAEIPGVIDDFRRAAANAMAAGFDGVEVP